MLHGIDLMAIKRWQLKLVATNVNAIAKYSENIAISIIKMDHAKARKFHIGIPIQCNSPL